MPGDDSEIGSREVSLPGETAVARPGSAVPRLVYSPLPVPVSYSHVAQRLIGLSANFEVACTGTATGSAA